MGIFALTWTALHLMQPKELVPWRYNFEGAVQEAKASKLPIFMDFTASWCGPCQAMRHTTWADPLVAKALTAYVPLSIDIDANPNLAAEFGVQTIPSFFVFDAESGKILKEYREGALAAGEFLRWLKR